MVPWHIAAGMSGAVMVLPRDGLKDGAGKPLRYDRVYYLGEQDLYVPRDTKGKFKSYPTHVDAFADTMDLMHKLIPDSQLHVFHGGHLGLVTEAAQLAPVVSEFLAAPRPAR